MLGTERNKFCHSPVSDFQKKLSVFFQKPLIFNIYIYILCILWDSMYSLQMIFIDVEDGLYA